MTQPAIRVKTLDDPHPDHPHQFVRTTASPDHSGWHWVVEGCLICGGSSTLPTHMAPLGGWST